MQKQYGKKKHPHTLIHVAYKHFHTYTQNTAKSDINNTDNAMGFNKKSHTKHSVTMTTKEEKQTPVPDERCHAKT